MTWIACLGLFVLGVMLSAFFSGSETGFYRVSQIRLRLAALSGDYIAWGMWWLSNRPSLFVATTLVGNNVANYLTSLAIVMAVNSLHLKSDAAAMVAPVLFSPIVFVFGESLPKQLYYQAPYYLLRKGGALFLFFGCLFSLISAVLWALSKVLERLVGASPQRVQLALGRRELPSVIAEGHAAGVLRPAQRRLAESIFAVATKPIARFALPPGRIAHVRLGMTKREVLRLARRHRLAELPVEEPLGGRKPIGYVRVAELQLSADEQIHDVHPMMEIAHDEPYLVAVVRLHEARQSMARIVGPAGQTLGLITTDLLNELLRGK